MNTKRVLLGTALCLLLACSTTQASNVTSSLSSSPFKNVVQITEKIFNKFKNQFWKDGIKGRASPDWGYMESFAHDLYGKSDYSWLLPLVVVVGFGTLLIPLMGTLMTTMITQGTINLTAGRRKRSISIDNLINQPYVDNFNSIVTNVKNALRKFNKEFND